MKSLALSLSVVLAGEPTGDYYETLWGDNEIAPIDAYVNYDDGYYKWSGGETPIEFDEKTIKKFDLVGIENVDVYYLNMTSQKWLDETVTTRSVWFHELYVIIHVNLNPNFDFDE